MAGIETATDVDVVIFGSGAAGGSAMHHFAVWPRLHESDFKVRSNHGVGLDWPIEYADLLPFYDRIQAEVGLSGDAAAETWRPTGADYPMPGLPIFKQGEVLKKGFDALGLKTAPIPLAINSTAHNNRPGCLFDGWCDAGCPIGALANPLVTYLPRAIAAGAQIIHEATATRVLHDASGARATGIEYADRAGTRHKVMAKQVFIAAFTVQSAKLLLQSVSDKHPNGMSNSNDMLGRYLTTHPSMSIYGLFPDDTAPYMGATGGQLINQDAYENKDKADGAFGSYQWLIANALKPNDLLGIATTRPDIIGPALDGFMRRAAHHMANMVCVGEDIGSPDNRVTLGSEKDEYDLPVAQTYHDVTPATRAMHEAAKAEGLAVFEAAGADEAWAGNPFGMHIMGGTVMGEDPANSVTDSYGRCHEMENVYVAGPGLFPSTGAVNPTFTIHALTLRTVDRLYSTS